MNLEFFKFISIQRKLLLSCRDNLTPNRKTLNAVIPISGRAAKWIRAQVGNRKVVSCRFDT